MEELSRSRIFLFLVLAFSYATVIPLVPLCGMRADYSGIVLASSIVASCLMVTTHLCSRRRAYALRAAVDTHLSGLLLILPQVLSTYVAAHVSGSWADPRLNAMDKALGWHWYNVVTMVDHNPALSWALVGAYSTFGLQLAVLPLILILTGRCARAYQMTVMAATMTFASAFISAWYPAVGTYSYYQFDLHRLQNLSQVAPMVFLDQVHAVKEDPNFTFILGQSRGIVTFPSMHAAISVLCVWAAWDLKAVRYPFLALNILMAASAAIVSNHYLVDVIAGFGVAGLVISSVLLVVRGTRHDIMVVAPRRLELDYLAELRNEPASRLSPTGRLSLSLAETNSAVLKTRI